MEKILRSTGYRVETNDDLREVVPAAFSMEHNRSRVYSFVHTLSILENLKKLGWDFTYAKQQGRSQYSRHIIRLTNPELGYMPLKNDQVRPQLILDNSHNGGSSAQLHMGLFRLVCQSEMVISITNLFTNIKFRHMGLDFEELKEILGKMTKQYEVVGQHISEMQNIVLSPEQKMEFAMKGVAYRNPDRYIKDDGTVDKEKIAETLNPNDLLQPMRGGDGPITLWDTFQNVREWVIKGGYEQKSSKGRKSTSKAINNAVRQISLNKTLWTLAEEYLNKPIETDIFNRIIEAANIGNGRTYTTSKGEKKKVLIVADLGNGRTQVKDIEANRIFAVETNKLS